MHARGHVRLDRANTLANGATMRCAATATATTTTATFASVDAPATRTTSRRVGGRGRSGRAHAGLRRLKQQSAVVGRRGRRRGRRRGDDAGGTRAGEDFFRLAAERAEEVGTAGEVAAVVATTALTLFGISALWENVWKQAVFPEGDGDDGEGKDDAILLHGVDVTRYPIFREPEVLRAVGFAAKWHGGQRRKNGDPYMKHCVESAKILAANLPGKGSKSRDAVCACLLHNVLDDTLCSDESLKGEFGTRVYNLVVQVSRVGQMNQVMRRRHRNVGDDDVKAKLNEEDLTQLKTLLLLIVRDPRVFLIKIADRLHNMRTIYAISNEKKAIDIANETLKVWCSLAEKLGMWAIKSELEDLCFAILQPQEFDAIISAQREAWKPRNSRDNDHDVSKAIRRSIFGSDTLPFFESTEKMSKSESKSFDEKLYDPWQLDMKLRIESIPSFDWLSNRDGNALNTDAMELLPENISSSLKTLDSIRRTVWRDLLIEGYSSDVKISIASRLKSAYSTHLKMKRKDLDFLHIYDARAMRIVIGDASASENGATKDIDACYEMIDLIHKLYRPIEGEYDDYITNPKQTGYRSLHTAVVGEDGAPLEVQVRTRSMHDEAEFGIAAQWMYKGRPKFASKSYQAAAQTDVLPSEGTPVQLVSGGRRSCGVVIEASGSRMLVAEPMRSKWSDVAPWIADGHHKALLALVLESKLKSARQGTRDFFISEFCYCVDQRWHRVDNLGHKTRVTAEIVDQQEEMESVDDERQVELDDVDYRIRQLQNVAGVFLNENDVMYSSDLESELSNWSLTAASIQKSKRVANAKKIEAEKEDSWRSGETETPSLNILRANQGKTAAPRQGIFQTEEAAKFEAELALNNPSIKTPSIDVEEGVMIITWNNDAPEVRSVKRGSTVAEIRDIFAPNAKDGSEETKHVNVNMTLVPPNTKLKDGDMIFLNEAPVTSRGSGGVPTQR